ncbi:enoyl-CoA hydratase/isomerase family protein [uncultured Desulfobacter sp.]|uniref:enoyl-CoA hydratase/isomerase family protein n=1 Tax=uncultured Desulfobacter sp. TaxID=240139 RepID=UPI0029F4C914|nr:enoyl-CoA hydratase/isomerase family protein [uncultured Desulfobacter sp.]
MAVIEWKKQNGVAIVSMNNAANRMNKIFSQDFKHCLDRIESDAQVKSIILTSLDEKNFSQGVDVEWIGEKFAVNQGQEVIDFMYGMNDVFKRLLLFPVPVIAAINGHAFGNGAILTCACDFRFMRKDKGFFCFPEVDIGIPFLPGMIALIRKALPEYIFNHMMLSGQRMTAVDLEHANVLVKACENQEDLMKEAMAFATNFDKKRGIFRELKNRVHNRVIRIMDEQDPEYIDTLNLFVAEE